MKNKFLLISLLASTFAFADNCDDLLKNKQYESALSICSAKAESGVSSAQRNLGLMFLLGYGVESSVTNSYKWFSTSAQSGDAVAQYFLGLFYTNGEGTKQDYTQAVYWYQKAANQNLADAQYKLGT